MNSIAANMGTCCMGWITALAPPDVMDLPPEVQNPAGAKDEPNQRPTDDDTPRHRDVGTEADHEHRGHRRTHHEMSEVVVIPVVWSVGWPKPKPKPSSALTGRHHPAGVVQGREEHQAREEPAQPDRSHHALQHPSASHGMSTGN